MTLGFTQWLRLLPSALFPGLASRRGIPPLRLSGLGARDVADLNLPPGMASRLSARSAAEDLRRRPFR